MRTGDRSHGMGRGKITGWPPWKIVGLALLPLLVFLAALSGDVRSDTGKILFDANANGSAESVLEGKNLGIGTTSTSANLHVLGNAYITQNLGIGTATPTASLQIQGALGMAPQTITSNTTASGNSVIIADTSSANLTLTLPYAGNVAGRTYYIKKASNSYTLSVRGGGNLIDDSSIFTLGTGGRQFPFINVVSNGNQWYSTGMSNSIVWSPTTVSNCILWLDASDSSYVTLTSGNVSTWSDKSGQGYNFTQGTAANQPLYLANGRNNKYVVKFDGTNDQLSYSRNWGKYLDVYFVGRFHTAPGSTDHYFSGNNTSMFALKYDTGAMYLTGGNTNANKGATAPTNYHYYRAYVDNTNLGVASDGNVEGTAGGADQWATSILNLGGVTSAYGKVEIAEFIIYNMKLATSDSNTVLTYLSSKWGF